MKTLVIIPYRLSASRLPGKPLRKINGLSIISHVYKKAQEADIGEVFVAAEDQEIIEDVKKNTSESFDLVFADPPYNMQNGEKLQRPDDSKVNGVNDKWDEFSHFKHYDNFSKTWLKDCTRLLKDKGSIWVIGP